MTAKKGHIVTEKTRKKLRKKLTRRKIFWIEKIKNTIKKQFIDGRKPWNYKLTKENDERVKKASNNLKKLYKEKKVDCGFKLGNKPHNKGKNKFNYIPMKKASLSILKKYENGYVNPNWRGGISLDIYSINFDKKFKRLIRKRDNYICLKCGKHQEKENRSLSVHHINYDKKLTIPQNCVSLCRKCHSEVNFNREHWTKFFQSLLAERYGYQYDKNQKIILEMLNGKK